MAKPKCTTLLIPNQTPIAAQAGTRVLCKEPLIAADALTSQSALMQPGMAQQECTPCSVARFGPCHTRFHLLLQARMGLLCGSLWSALRLRIF